MSGTAQPKRGPWFGLTSLAISVGLLDAIHFLSTAEGQHWVEELFSPLGYAAMLLGIVGPLLFLGLSGMALALALFSVMRDEPFRLAELAATIVWSLFLQIASSRADLWGEFPVRLLYAGVFSFGAGSFVRWLVPRIRRSRG